MGHPVFGTPEGTRCRFVFGKAQGSNSVQPELPNLPPAGWIIMFETRPENQKCGHPNGYPHFWYAGRDSNPQPSEPESDALSIEPPAHLILPMYYNSLFFVCKEVRRKIFLLFLSGGGESGCFSAISVI